MSHKPVFPPDNPEALRCFLRVGWLAELLRHHTLALHAGDLPVASQDEHDDVTQMLAECWRLHELLKELFPDPALADVVEPTLILHGSTVIAVDEIPF